jgi:hypothetical protein
MALSLECGAARQRSSFGSHKLIEGSAVNSTVMKNSIHR